MSSDPEGDMARQICAEIDKEALCIITHYANCQAFELIRRPTFVELYEQYKIFLKLADIDPEKIGSIQSNEMATSFYDDLIKESRNIN